jgi:xanthine dehydrogenase accessory factor
MREILPEIEKWRLEGKLVAIATIVKVYGSAPRPIGSKMAVSSTGDVVGSVSGGCLEGAVIEESQKVIKTGVAKLMPFGISNSQAWDIGLACGGEVEIFVEEIHGSPAIDSFFDTLSMNLQNHQLVALATIIDGPGLGNKLLIWPDGKTHGSLGRLELDHQVSNFVPDLLTSQISAQSQFQENDLTFKVFIEIFPPPPRLIIVGAVHIAIPLVTFAQPLGFHTIVIDARSFFATRERFPHADRLEIGWPADILKQMGLDVSSHVVILTHDDKVDIPALHIALGSPARYIGILGSSKTHAQRIATLKEMGVSDENLSRIHSPIGLHLGSVGANEIALSIMAEIIAVKYNLA